MQKIAPIEIAGTVNPIFLLELPYVNGYFARVFAIFNTQKSLRVFMLTSKHLH